MRIEINTRKHIIREIATDKEKVMSETNDGFKSITADILDMYCLGIASRVYKLGGTEEQQCRLIERLTLYIKNYLDKFKEENDNEEE